MGNREIKIYNCLQVPEWYCNVSILGVYFPRSPSSLGMYMGVEEQIIEKRREKYKYQSIFFLMISFYC